MKFIIQTLPYAVFKESEKINKLFEAGLEVLHLRKAALKKSELSKIISEIDESFHNRIVLHDHYSLLRKYNLKGIHVELSDVGNVFKKQYIKYLKNKHNVTVSVLSKDILDVKLKDDLFDYIFIGPLYVKYSEESISPQYNFFELKKDLKNCKFEVHATGCSNIKNLEEAKSIGFKGAVLQSYIWKSEDILNAFKTACYKLGEQTVTVHKKDIAI